MHMKVTHDQFALDGEKLTHQPTGAQFWMGDKDVVICEPGSAGADLPSGHDYDPEEIKQAAWEIFQLEKTKSL